MKLRERIRRLQNWAYANLGTVRLTASYLAIIMVLTVAFSFVIYQLSSSELGRQLPPNNVFDQTPGNSYFHFFRDRISEGRHELLGRLLLLNLLVLVLGAIFSYLLARLTLEPIERSMEAQSRFASDASHELRTPLAAIQAENEVALRNPKLNLKRAKQLLGSNLEEAARLQALSDGLLKLARHDEQELTIRSVPASQAVSEAVNHVLKAAQAKGIMVEDRVSDFKVLGDAGSVSQILTILLDNAIKYSDKGAKIEIGGRRSGKQGLIVIKDEGSGIAAEDMPHIFERFYRADSSRSKQNAEGHGLGLALAAKLAHQMGGEIEATSRHGHGSTFTLKLPLA